MNLNVVCLSGNIVREPEVSFTQQGMAIAKFAIAINEGYGDQSRTHFIDCVAFKKTAENIQQRLHKGQGITLRGNLNQEKWNAQDGSARSRITVIVREWMWTTPPQHQPPDGQPGYQRQAPAQQAYGAPSAQQRAPQGGYGAPAQAQPAQQGLPYGDTGSYPPDDEIPF